MCLCAPWPDRRGTSPAAPTPKSGGIADVHLLSGELIKTATFATKLAAWTTTLPLHRQHASTPPTAQADRREHAHSLAAAIGSTGGGSLACGRQQWTQEPPRRWIKWRASSPSCWPTTRRRRPRRASTLRCATAARLAHAQRARLHLRVSLCVHVSCECLPHSQALSLGWRCRAAAFRANRIDGSSLLQLDVAAIQSQLGIGAYGTAHKLATVADKLRQLNAATQPRAARAGSSSCSRPVSSGSAGSRRRRPRPARSDSDSGSSDTSQLMQAVRWEMDSLRQRLSAAGGGRPGGAGGGGGTPGSGGGGGGGGGGDRPRGEEVTLEEQEL